VGESESLVAETTSTFCSPTALGRTASFGGVAGLGAWKASIAGVGEGWVGGEGSAAGRAAGEVLRNKLPSFLKPLFFGGAWVGPFTAERPD